MFTVRPYDVLPSPLLEQTDETYQALFKHINEMAAQRHLLTSAELYEVATNPAVTKLIALRDDRDPGDPERVLGMATITNNLDAWPLVSPPFYRRLYPEHYAAKAVWYVGFVGARPRTRHVFRTLVEELYHLVIDGDRVIGMQGVVGMDFCTYNEITKRLPGLTLGLLQSWDPRARVARVDAQSTWVYRFDEVDGPPFPPDGLVGRALAGMGG